MDSLDTCVKLEMTKIRSRAGPNGVSHLERTHFFVNYSFTFVIDWCAPLNLECCFAVLRSLRRCVLTSPDQANGSFTTLGIASCALSYLYPYIRDHYEFVLCYTYGVLPDIPLVYGGVYSAV